MLNNMSPKPTQQQRHQEEQQPSQKEESVSSDNHNQFNASQEQQQQHPLPPTDPPHLIQPHTPVAGVNFLQKSGIRGAVKPKLAQSFRDAAPYNPMIRNVVVAFDINMAKADEEREGEGRGGGC